MYLSKVAVSKPELAQYAKARGFPRRLTPNYLIHSVLAESFSGCPTPFSAEEKGSLYRVLFYSDADADELTSRAQIGASPEAYEVIRWEETASKPFPETFPGDLLLQFEIRACPVVRKASAGEGENEEGEPRTWEEGDELDVYLARQWTSDDELSREEVYVDWLQEQFEVRGGAKEEKIEMKGFTLVEMTRRKGENDRTLVTMTRPDVTLTGTLRVSDSEEFIELLHSGLGRHKSFGYGMLKIRPA